MGRGALIVLEGCDRAGKSSQSKMLVKALQDRGIPVSTNAFPDRTTNIGSMIDQYLSNKAELAPETVHLLFSANRWERRKHILKVVESGTTLILDRYAASGAAYTAATTGRDLSWCKEPDRGLPAPDLVAYLDVSEESQKQRSNWGQERFEKRETQNKVASNFEKLRDNTWIDINADLPISEIHEDLLQEVLQTIERLCLNSSVAVLDIIVTWASRKTFSELWNVMQDVDVKLGTLGYRKSEIRTKQWIWCTFILNFLLWAVISQAGMIAFDEPYIQNITYLSIYMGSCFSVIKFSGFLLLLEQRFGFLNDIARRNGAYEVEKNGTLKPKDGNMKIIEIFYDTLVSIGERFDKIYSWILFLFLMNLGSHSISNLYFISVSALFQSLDDDKNDYIAICLFSWLSAYLAQLILLYSSCHYTTKKASLLAYNLLEWRRCFIQRDVKRSNTRLDSTLHLMHRTLQFSAGGCFYVNLPLLCSTAALCGTYLIILLQLRV